MDLPNEDRLRWLLTRSAWLLDCGCEPVAGLIEPTSRFFPERPDGTAESMRALFARTIEHAGLADVDIDVSIHVPDQDPLGGGCSSGVCGPKDAQGDKGPPLLGRHGEGYAVALPGALAGAPPLLGAHLTRVAAAMFLHEADAIATLDRREIYGAVDLAATWLGFGVIAAANGSHVVSKGCGGIRITRATTLPVEEIGVALAMFAELFEIPAQQARRHLEPTPREAFDEGAAWTRANAATVRLLRTSPRAIEEGAFRLKPARGWIARTFGLHALGLGAKRPPTDALEADDDQLVRELSRARAATESAKAARPVDAARAARLARARAAVDDALAEE